jgi:hypothetical protein
MYSSQFFAVIEGQAASAGYSYSLADALLAMKE